MTIEDRASTRSALRTVLCAALLVVVSLIAAGCGSSAESAGAADGKKVRGGSLTIGMEQQPSCLNTWISCGGTAVTGQVVGPLFDGMFMIDEKGERVPLLATEIPTTENRGVVVQGKGMIITVHLKPEGRWSDGKSITCDDVRFTLDTIMDERWMVTARTGYELVTKLDCPDPLTAVYHFKERYAPFLNVVGAAPLPKHALEGKDFNTYMNDRVTVTSGPFVFDHWDRSVEIVLKRNPKYWNAGKDEEPWLDELRYVFVADTNTLKIQLRTGEVDVISPPPDSSLKQELEKFPRGGFDIEPDVYWEQLAFNTAKAPTNDINVRKAIAASVDRNKITDVVLKKQVGVLQSTLLESQKDYFVPAWEDVKVSKTEAATFLEASGYKRSGKYYAKGGKTLTVQFKSTAGNVLRLKVAQVLQEELAANGIKMDILMEPGEVFFGQSTPTGAFNLGLWAWSSGTDPSQRTLFSCDMIPSEANDGAGNNYYRYCNERVTELLKRADVTPDVAERAKLTHEVQTLMRADMPILPIFQRPSTTAYSDRAVGIVNNPLGGLTWNTYDWGVRAQ